MFYERRMPAQALFPLEGFLRVKHKAREPKELEQAVHTQTQL
jgi:hypothetical protein